MRLFSISVIIVNWNGIKVIEGCLDGLEKQSFKDFSIIVVDNKSNDGSLGFVHKKFPEVKTIALNENFGFAKANNVAIKSLNTKYVALLNPDTVPTPNWLENLLKALQNHPEAGLTASKMLLYDQPGVIDHAGDAYTTAARLY